MAIKMATQRELIELAGYIPVSKAKNRLLSLIRELEQNQEAMALTRDGVCPQPYFSASISTGDLSRRSSFWQIPEPCVR